MERRAWILGGTLATGAALSGFLWSRRRDIPRKSQARLTHTSGPVALPPGFECTILTRSGERQSDGTRSPNLPDGMACFSGNDGNWILLRNHELMRDAAQGAYPRGQPDGAYDRSCHGGVSRLVLRPGDLSVQSSNMVLTGTLRNCAGGPKEDGWITCEEAIDPGHGYAFFCNKDAKILQKPQIIPGYGRYRHEAVAFDPMSGRAYLTEDEGDGCLYRFTPTKKDRPFEGRLEALRVTGKPQFQSSLSAVEGTSLAIDWVEIADPDAKNLPTRIQAQRLGAAIFSRGEGAWMDGEGMVFTATSGGRAGLGQLFRVNFNPGTVTLVAEAKSQEDFNGPDNVTVAPWGDFVVAEDTVGPTHVYGVDREGHCYPMLRNIKSVSEICGVCFSPDGTVLFCNLQWDGLTLAIRGPFQETFATASLS